jgi:hypothetical protein
VKPAGGFTLAEPSSWVRVSFRSVTVKFAIVMPAGMAPGIDTPCGTGVAENATE